jgi:archaeosine-15-forming tRNA-guanine transglycosylase
MEKEVSRGFLGSPKEVFMAVFDNAEKPKQLFESLRGRGVTTEQVMLLSPQDSDALETKDTSGPRVLFRKMLGLEELEVEQSYAQALQDGKYVMQIQVLESDEELRKHVEEILLAHQAQKPVYFGTTAFKNVAASTTSQ